MTAANNTIIVLYPQNEPELKNLLAVLIKHFEDWKSGIGYGINSAELMDQSIPEYQKSSKV